MLLSQTINPTNFSIPNKAFGRTRSLKNTITVFVTGSQTIIETISRIPKIIGIRSGKANLITAIDLTTVVVAVELIEAAHP